MSRVLPSLVSAEIVRLPVKARRSKVTAEEVRARFDAGRSDREIAQEFGCSPALICIKRRALGLTRTRAGVHRKAIRSAKLHGQSNRGSPRSWRRQSGP